MSKSIALIGMQILLLLGSASNAVAQGAKPKTGENHEAGRQAYEAACLSCHYQGARKADFGSRNPSGKGSADELISKTLFGVPAEDDEPGLRMPGFSSGLTDAQVAGIAAYLRATRTKAAPWTNLEKLSATIRARGPRDE